MPNLINRRLIVGGLSALGVTTAVPFAAAQDKSLSRIPVEGLITWSESVMVLCLDSEIRNGLSMRLSRYPDLGLTWLWIHVIRDGEVYAYTDQFLPSTGTHITSEQMGAEYTVPGVKARMARTGTAAGMQGMSFSADVLAHRGPDAINGPGTIPISLSGVFHPGALHKNAQAGRFERSGHVEAVTEVAGRKLAISGVAKAHEQTQTNPRFGSSFTYAMLWSDKASLVGLLARDARFGDFISKGEDRPINQFYAEPWSPQRKFAAKFKDGTVLQGEAKTRVRFEVPVFNRVWHGQMVQASIGGERMVGMVNDWKPEDQPYGLPQ